MCDQEVKIGALEKQIRRLTGRVEQAEKGRDEAIRRAEVAENVLGKEWWPKGVPQTLRGDKPINCGTSKESVDAISDDIRASTQGPEMRRTLFLGGILGGYWLDIPRGMEGMSVYNPTTDKYDEYDVYGRYVRQVATTPDLDVETTDRMCKRFGVNRAQP